MTMRRSIKRALVAAIILGMVCPLAMVTWVRGGGPTLSGDPSPYFSSRHAPIIRVTETTLEQDNQQQVEDIRLDGDSGLGVRFCVKRPAGPGPFPVVVMLVGYRTGRQAVSLVKARDPLVLVALDYPYEGNLRVRGWDAIRAIPDFRQTLYDAVPATMMVMDYLEQQPYVNPDQVELVGVSLGAPLACIVGNLDTRFDRVWAVEGGGDIRQMYEANLQSKLKGPFRRAGAWFLSTITSTLAPENWVAGIAPRPFIMINARRDLRIPKPCVDVLYRAAQEPKQLIWIDEEHITTKAEQQINLLYGMVRDRVIDQRIDSSL